MPNLNNDQFLVVRRDGSIASGVFVLDPETNPAASAALQGMANAAETFGLMSAQEAEQFRELAAEWGNRPPVGTPEPERGPDVPAVVRILESGGKLNLSHLLIKHLKG